MTDRWASLYSEHLRTIRQRADHALERAGYQSLAVYSGALAIQFLDDTIYPFKVNPHFKGWVPVTDNPECFIVYTPGEKPRLLFHRPQDYWHKPAALPDASWVREFDVHPIASLAEARALLPASLAGVALIGAPSPEVAAWGFAAVNPPALLDSLHYARAIKTAYEIESMAEASRRAARGHRAAEQTFRAGGSEYDAHMAYLEACAQREEEMPYNNIVAFNENSAVLHYQNLERTPAPASARRSFLIDAGASWHGYASDITRTHSARMDEFAELVRRFDDLQQSLCATLSAGTDWREFQMLSHAKVAEFLREADVIRAEPAAAVASGLSKIFFPHGIGHLLGLQVHDVGGFMRDESGATIEKPPGQPYLRLTRKLETGFVVTVEPGVYFIDQLLEQARTNGVGRDINWNRVAELKPYGGIRIEDDVVITEQGHRNLTREAFAATS
jgi:Xaa-Pro dipeptidase